MLQEVKVKDLSSTLAQINNDENIYLPSKKDEKVKGQFSKKGNQYEIKIDDAFQLSFTISKRNDIQYSFSIKPEKASSVSKLVKLFMLVKDLLSGTIFINDIKLADYKLKASNQKDLENFSLLIDYWSKVQQIEQELNMTFIPSDIIKNDFADYNNFNRLVRCLVDKKPYKLQALTLESINIKTTRDSIKALTTDKEVNLFFQQISDISFAGKKIKIYIATAIFNVLIDKINYSDENNEPIDCTIYPKKDAKNVYVVEKIFANSDSVNKYLNDNTSREELANAKLL